MSSLARASLCGPYGSWRCSSSRASRSMRPSWSRSAPVGPRVDGVGRVANHRSPRDPLREPPRSGWTLSRTSPSVKVAAGIAMFTYRSCRVRCGIRRQVPRLGLWPQDRLRYPVRSMRSTTARSRDSSTRSCSSRAWVSSPMPTTCSSSAWSSRSSSRSGTSRPARCRSSTRRHSPPRPSAPSSSAGWRTSSVARRSTATRSSSSPSGRSPRRSLPTTPSCSSRASCSASASAATIRSAPRS